MRVKRKTISEFSGTGKRAKYIPKSNKVRMLIYSRAGNDGIQQRRTANKPHGKKEINDEETKHGIVAGQTEK